MLGRKFSAESLIKLSKSKKGHPVSEEQKIKLRIKNVGQHRSEETKARLKAAWVKRRLKYPVRRGLRRSEETKQKLRNYRLGKIPWNKGILHSEETKRKMKSNHADFNEDKHPRWKGGRQALVSRRRRLGFIPLNQKFRNSEAHHLDHEHVIFIPKSLHRSIWHDLNDSERMERINTKIYCWILGGDVI
jgi:hypothetical protein